MGSTLLHGAKDDGVADEPHPIEPFLLDRCCKCIHSYGVGESRMDKEKITKGTEKIKNISIQHLKPAGECRSGREKKIEEGPR